jgi:putative addiction module component (TIGR02574 family)
MTATLQSLGIDRLTVAERLELLELIWDSIARETERTPLTDDRAEVDRRLSAHRQNPNAAIPWEQVEAEALARLQK